LEGGAFSSGCSTFQVMPSRMMLEPLARAPRSRTDIDLREVLEVAESIGCGILEQRRWTSVSLVTRRRPLGRLASTFATPLLSQQDAAGKLTVCVPRALEARQALAPWVCCLQLVT